MLFNSLHFLVFFPLVVLLYYSLKAKFRWALLLAASYYFYLSWEPAYLILIVVSTTVDYFCAIEISKAHGVRRKVWLATSLCVNLGILGFFKYANFFASSWGGLIGAEEQTVIHSFLLPVGISFYTFQTLSYSLDVYAGRISAYRHFGRFALFVSFFPQLVAGPIERASHLLPQFDRTHRFDLAGITTGLRQMLWGMFKKVVIADRLALVVNQVYSNPADQSSLTWLLATYFFAFQIYCDFSGYSDIAIGAARVLGFKLSKNFNVPYIAGSVREFWQRWHISLSTWFRDYVYIPLGGARVELPRWAFNIMITFFVSGLWHGANWTFVVWGGLHGFYLLAERGLSKIAGSLQVPTFLRRLLVFHLVLIAWVFFRADTVYQAWAILSSIFTEIPADIRGFLSGESVFLGFGLISETVWKTLIPASLIFYLVDMWKENTGAKRIFEASGGLRLLLYALLLYGILFLGYFGETQFIYFQF